MTKKTISKILAGFLAGSMLLAGCTTTGDNTGTSTPASQSGAETSTGETSTPEAAPGQKIIRTNNSSEPGSLHPALATGTHDSWPLNHMFEGLYAKDPEGGPAILAAAESVETSADGLVWTFKMDPASKWSNGDPVTAHDFVSNFKFCLDPANAANYASQLYVLKNGQAVHERKMGIEELGAKALDDATLEITLESALPYLPDLLTHYTFYPIHTANSEANPQWYVTPENYVCNGAFVLTEWKNKESITITKNPNFRDAANVKLDAIYFTIIEDPATTWQMFEAGELDVVYPIPPAITEQLRNEGSPLLHTFADLSLEYYQFNVTKKPFNNAKVRKALSMAINRQTLVENIVKGGEEPAYSLTVPGISDGNGDFQKNLGPLFSEDAAGAKALLEEGLAEEGMALEGFTFSLIYNTLDTHKKNAEAIQAMWMQNLGVQVTLENAEFQVVLDRRKSGDYDVARAGWVGDYSDPMTFVELLTSWNEFNYGRWFNDDYDALIKTAQTNMDNDVRMNAMKDAERLAFTDEMPVAPLYFKKQNWAVSENVTGTFKPVNRYLLLYYADIA